MTNRASTTWVAVSNPAGFVFADGRLGVPGCFSSVVAGQTAGNSAAMFRNLAGHFRDTCKNVACLLLTAVAVISGLFLGLATSGVVLAAPSEDVLNAQAASAEGDGSDDSGPLPEGHSGHGEVFNEGPRQAAWLMEGVGRVQFDVTTESREAAAFVVQGIGQLHGFWYFESERSFRQAAAIDPGCAIAYWGMAMSNRSNADRAKGFISEAMDRRSIASRREQLYIEVFDCYINSLCETDAEKETRARKYVEDLESLLLEFPDDIEAKAFLCEFQWSASRDGMKINSHLAVDALIQDVLDVEPLHPAHHYRIHLWDKKHPEQALASVGICGQAAPAIAHMWHMPGHIYSRLKRYHEAVYQQEASARVDHAHMMKHLVLPDQIHNFAHNNEWCIRNLIHIGRVRDAIDLAKNMSELPRHPKYNHIGRSGSYKYGRQRLLDVLRTYQLHEEIVVLADTPYLRDTGDETADLDCHRAVGSALAAIDRLSEARAIRDKLLKLRDDIRDEQKTASEKAAANAEAEGEAADVVETVRKKTERPFRVRIRKVRQAVQEINGRLALHRGDYDRALTLWEKAKNVPVEEQVAAMLAGGKKEEAVKRIADHVNANENEVRPLACQVKTLWEADEHDQAKQALEALREISSTIDVDVPVFSELTPIARELGFDADWRLVPDMVADRVGRPRLDTLGPFRWEPVPAPDWTLPGIDDRPVALRGYHGRPVVLIFYLGYGCLHCAEQLQSFQPKVETFREAGLELLAISTDPQELLGKALENYDGDFSISLAADPDLRVFRKYRCYDDFEKQPLHGTFVIDAAGRIRWQDVSYEPFMDPEFVLEEARRLVKLKGESSAAAETSEVSSRTAPIPGSSEDATTSALEVPVRRCLRDAF